MADTLIEDQFDGYSGIRAGQYRGEWLLLFDRVLLKNRKVMLVSGKAAPREPFIAVHQFVSKPTTAPVTPIFRNLHLDAARFENDVLMSLPPDRLLARPRSR